MSAVPYTTSLSIPTDVSAWEKKNRREKAQEKFDLATLPWQDYEVRNIGLQNSENG